MIYFIQNTRNGLVKVGYSNNPRGRMAKLQTGSTDKLRLLGDIPGDREHEQFLHRRFQRLRRYGEWFALTERQVAELIECEAVIESEECQRLLPFGPTAPATVPLIFVIDVRAA